MNITEKLEHLDVSIDRAVKLVNEIATTVSYNSQAVGYISIENKELRRQLTIASNALRELKKTRAEGAKEICDQALKAMFG